MAEKIDKEQIGALIAKYEAEISSGGIKKYAESRIRIFAPQCGKKRMRFY